MGHEHVSNTKRIWMVFIILSVVTIVEVVLGIYKPESLVFNSFISMSYLNWIFILLTIYKAYYIVWAFMHIEGERNSMKWSIVAPLVFLILYLMYILLVEGDYIYDVFKNSTIKWNF